MNQGMLMESINLAAVWNLPVLFVCKDDDWAITTRPEASTRGDLRDRVRGLGAEFIEVDGLDVEQVWEAAKQAIEGVRSGNGPAFLHARCVHLEGHLLGNLLLRAINRPLRELPRILIPLVRSFLRRGGGSLNERVAGMRFVTATLVDTVRDPRRSSRYDPVALTRKSLNAADPKQLKEIDKRIKKEISTIHIAALEEVAA